MAKREWKSVVSELSPTFELCPECGSDNVEAQFEDEPEDGDEARCSLCGVTGTLRVTPRDDDEDLIDIEWTTT